MGGSCHISFLLAFNPFSLLNMMVKSLVLEHLLVIPVTSHSIRVFHILSTKKLKISIFLGCTDYMKSELGNKYRIANVYGHLFDSYGNHGDKYFDIWTMGVWNSFCITGNNGEQSLKVYVNGKIVVEDKDYSGFLRQASSNVDLMKNYHTFLDGEIKSEITDVNIWNQEKPQSFIQSWSNCDKVEEGNIVKWSKSEFMLSNVLEEDLPHTDVDVCKDHTQYIVSEYKRDFDETVKFCSIIGGKMAVASNETILHKMKSSVANFSECSNTFFVGFTDMDQEGSWKDVNTGKPMTFEYWAEGEPDNFARFDQDCAVYGSAGMTKFKDKSCPGLYCPVCEVKMPVKYQLHGDVQTHIDRHYVMKNLTAFMGYMSTIIVLNNGVWEMRSLPNDTVLAKLMMPLEGENECKLDMCPFGSHDWQWIYPTGKKIKMKLNFHVAAEQPGNYVCNDGMIIPSAKVCDKVQDCSGGEEENCKGNTCPCGLIEDTKATKVIQTKDQNKVERSIEVKTSVSILEVLDISQDKSTFTLYFWMRLQWFNHNYNIYFLQDVYKLNTNYRVNQRINKVEEGNNTRWEKTEVEMPWTPNLTFIHLDETPLITFDMAVYIERRMSPHLSEDQMNMNGLQNEIYKGEENPFIKDSLHQAEFTCSFDNIENYPFGRQNCSFGFFLTKTTAKLVAGNITYQKAQKIGQYVISDHAWSLSCSQENQIVIKGCLDCDPISPCKVTVMLERNLVSVITVSFLPPLLMNIINQASVYLKGESKYDLIITVNITIMMVLASVYLSVSSSLPNTPNIKPVELWLLFNLTYPFFVIIVTVIIQVKHNPFPTSFPFLIIIYL